MQRGGLCGRGFEIIFAGQRGILRLCGDDWLGCDTIVGNIECLSLSMILF